ncbi:MULTISPECIES: hypothetical protein [Thauera]|jgi:hypothetical protein|uniref:hypothetical protein n=1 Tax=Thauera TaxID=33057 RepID=UPI0002CD9187|nr:MULTISPECIES: hypothetical protein [Thauera]ENO79397.1 hypothetical protein C664_04007 [Thauera sp. 63]CAH1745928.1 conserved protein of unknown function [Thauera humireducens]
MNAKHPAQAPHTPVVGAGRRSLQHRLGALRAGLKAALRAFRTHPNKHPQR